MLNVEARPLASLPIYAANSTFNSTTLNPIYGDLPSFNGSTVYERMVGLVDANIAMQQVMLQALITTLPDATLRVFDTYSYINGLIADPIPVFGPDANTTGFCACSDAACDYCTDPERYLWQNSECLAQLDAYFARAQPELPSRTSNTSFPSGLGSDHGRIYRTGIHQSLSNVISAQCTE